MGSIIGFSIMVLGIWLVLFALIARVFDGDLLWIDYVQEFGAATLRIYND